MTPVGFEPTQLALVELESTPLDHSGKVSLRPFFFTSVYASLTMLCNLRGVHGVQESILMSCGVLFLMILGSIVVRSLFVFVRLCVDLFVCFFAF